MAEAMRRRRGGRLPAGARRLRGRRPAGRSWRLRLGRGAVTLRQGPPRARQGVLRRAGVRPGRQRPGGGQSPRLEVVPHPRAVDVVLGERRGVAAGQVVRVALAASGRRLSDVPHLPRRLARRPLGARVGQRGPLVRGVPDRRAARVALAAHPWPPLLHQHLLPRPGFKARQPLGERGPGRVAPSALAGPRGLGGRRPRGPPGPRLRPLPAALRRRRGPGRRGAA
mmetsp:Transcript_103452/g.316674  ORF Transcript_103452/g.316674 Transcript_103452/m.316674 type:complete len:225 (-) Transcript_103452:463-1137(-)